MNDPINPVSSTARSGAGLRWAVAIVALACVIAALFLVLFKGWPGGSLQANDISSPDATRSLSYAYVDRWIAVDEITRPDTGLLDISELTITVGKGLLVVEMRGQQVDEVQDGKWVQKPCPSSCLLGVAYATAEDDAMVTSVKTAPGLIHQLTLKVKAPTPGSDALLTVADTILLEGKPLASYTRKFVSNGLIHPERMMDTGLSKLR